MTSFEKLAEPPFVTETGDRAPARVEEDPYQALDELTVVVEALCPVWPPRAGFVNGGRMLL